MYGGFTDPVRVSYDPARAGQPAIPFSDVLRGAACIPQAISSTLCPIGNGLLQLAIQISLVLTYL